MATAFQMPFGNLIRLQPLPCAPLLPTPEPLWAGEVPGWAGSSLVNQHETGQKGAGQVLGTPDTGAHTLWVSSWLFEDVQGLPLLQGLCLLPFTS